MEDRQILDGVLMANELVHMRRKEKKPDLLFKIDMEKAYEFVDWSFLGYLFEKDGFWAVMVSVDEILHRGHNLFCLGQWFPNSIYKS